MYRIIAANIQTIKSVAKGEKNRFCIKGRVSSRCEVKESGARVIRKDPGETGHHSKRLDGTCLLGRITGRSWTLTFAAFAPREALPGEAPRVSSSRGWPECDLLLQSLRHPHAQEILLVSALPRAHGSLAQLWAWNGRPVIRGASETQRKLLCNLPVLHGGVGGGCSPSPLPRTPMVLFTRPPPRFHNGTLLDRRTHRYGAHLELHGLRPDQAGTYHCKAWNDAGAVRSGAARLTVLGEHLQ